MSAAVGLVLVAAGAFPAVASAQVASPWWSLSTDARPTDLAPGSTGVVVASAANVGVAAAEGPVTITDRLPAGISPAGPKAVAFRARVVGSHGENDLGPKGTHAALGLCAIAGQQIQCTYRDTEELEELGHSSSEAEGFPSLRPYFGRLELRIAVNVSSEAPLGALMNEVAVSGAGSANAYRQPLRISEEPAPFGIESFQFRLEREGGAPATQAGSHPFQLTNVLTFNQGAEAKNGRVEPVQLPRDLSFRLPPGMLGNVAALPKCTESQFATQDNSLEYIGYSCPTDTQIGVAAVNYYAAGFEGIGNTVEIVPVFNLAPAFGEPARFGFHAGPFPVALETSVRSGNGEDYGVSVSVKNVIQLAGLLSSEVTFWGTPGDPLHDPSRGYECLDAGRHCILAEQHKPGAFLTLPTSCPADPVAEPFSVGLTARSWLEPAEGAHPEATADLRDQQERTLGMDGCNKLPFSPSFDSQPTADAATSPSGMEVDLNVDDEGLLNPEGLAQSQIKKVRVALPEGMSANPSLAEGLKACSMTQYQSETLDSTPGIGCPSESKIGSVEIESPLVEQVLHGSLYVAKQGDNPFHSLLALYIVAKNRELGVMVRSAGKVEPNPVTGQLVTTFDNVPQLPFNRFHLSFRSGQRSPLITPPACGTYDTEAQLYPWSEPNSPVEQTSSFQITAGPEGQGCPSGGVPPFHPNLEAGTQNNAAGTYSPFYTHITRKDSEQEITRFSIKLPPGVIGKLAGVSSCSDAAIAAAKAREHEGGGQEELNSPSCPANSEVGHSLVGSGVGNVLAYAPGKLYLAGPYHGSPISIVSITAAKVGPFDLGTVVVRFALNIDPETAEVSVDGSGSDPIPHIVDGIPVHLRDIRAYVDRPNFTLNPTSCAKKSTASTILGSGLDFVSPADDNPVTVSSPFQAADCASLGFKPSLALSLDGKSHRGALPAFKAVLTYPKKGAYANIAKAQVTLPSSENLEQAHLEDVCPKSVFTTGSTPGENCPASSIYGTARAYTPLLDEPLEGPVFLRTGYGTRLPELTATLNNKQIHIVLAGKIDTVLKKGTEISRIRNTFELVPDAPVSKFVLEMKGGSKGLLVNKTNICRGTHKAIAAFTAQNGKLHEFQTVVKANACAKQARKSRHG